MGSSRTASCTLRAKSSASTWRSEEHTSELQSQSNLVCRLLLEKKKKSPVHVSTAAIVLHEPLVKARVGELVSPFRCRDDRVGESSCTRRCRHAVTLRHRSSRQD